MTTRLPSYVLALLIVAAAARGQDIVIAAPPAVQLPVTIYDPDPQHLWNRLHRAIWVRTGPDGKDYGHDRLDPLLWAETRHLVEGKSHEQAIAVLDEFLAERGETLLNDPLKRAILQRDLWAVFDWSAEPRANTREAHLQRPPPARRALQQRLTRCIQRLALTSEEIKSLPDNYAAAVASRAFAGEYDPEHPERPFLLPDLFQKDGPWVEVEIDNSSAVIATRHVFDFGARSAFRVFLRFPPPEGRPATIAYFDALRTFPQPRVITRQPNQKQDTIELNPDLPQIPVGTQAALVRQMLLVDDDGRIANTPVTESVQFRAFRAIPPMTPERRRRRDDPTDQNFYEFTRSRELLFAGKTGGLRPLGPDDKDFRTQLLVHLSDEFEAKDNDRFERALTPPIRRCINCHDGPGIHSFRSFTGGNYPRGQFYLPVLSENTNAGSQAQLSAMRKREHFSWGLLQGLWEDEPRR